MAPELAPDESDDRPRAESFTRILSGRAWVRGRLQPVDIGISEEGRIVRLARALSGAPRTDVGDAVVLPSATDLHVHFREPGPPDAVESFSSGSIQAALGGTGTVADMPNSVPPIDSVDRLLEKQARARGRLAVDLVIYALPSRLGLVPALGRRAGAFKLYLSPTTGVEGSAAEDPPLAPVLDAVAAAGLALAVHAEEPEEFVSTVRPTNPVDWNAHRPPSAEMRAVERLLPAPLGLRLHVAHVTVPAIAETLERSGESFEVSPHHLWLSAKASQDGRFKVNPPLRSEADRRALFERYATGHVPMLASDHAPHSMASKEGPFALAPSGVPGVETMLPLLLAAVRSGRVPLPVALATAVDRPARWLGLSRGRLAPGDWADLLVVDFRARRRLRASALHAPCGWTPFEGFEAIFPRDHYRHGERIVAGGEYVGRPSGQVVRPDYAPVPSVPSRKPN